MVIYRPHRGGLEEALAEAKEFESIEEMKQYIYEHFKFVYADLGYKMEPFSIEDIVIAEETADDKRCGWHDTRHVCIKRLLNEDFMEKYGSPQCIGHCATDYEKPETEPTTA